MLKVGITGGIGSGKTTVCKVFELLKVPVFYADTAAKEIMVKDAVLVEQIKRTFGKESYFEDNSLNRKHLSKIVFNDTKELAKLNALVHPAVFRAFDVWLQQIPENTPYILKEAALLFESDSYKLCDKSILVLAPEKLRLKWVMLRDGVLEADVKARMEKQFSDEQKISLADYQIINDQKHSIIEQVMVLHNQFSNN